MKKLFSLLLVVAMLASLSLVAYAADNNTMSVEVVENDASIVVTYYVTNPSDIAGFVASLTYPTTLTTDKSCELGEDFVACGTPTVNTKTGNIKFLATFGTATDKYVTKDGKIKMLSFTLTRTNAETVYSSSDFAYGTGLYVAKLTVGTSELKSTTNTDNFIAPVYKDDRAPVVEDKPEEGWEEGSAADLTSEEKAAWDGAFKFKGQDGNDKTEAAPGKKLVIFAKNATAKTLEAGKYGVKIGKNDYPGLAAVAGGKAWAIIILDENGNQVAKESYEYTAYVGETNVFSGTVTAE